MNLSLGEWTDFRIAMAVASVFILGFLLLLIIVWFRARNQRLCTGTILCEFVPKAGKAFHKFLRAEHGVLTIPKSKKSVGKEYGIAELATYPIDYPQGWPKIVTAEAQKAIFYEESAEPAFNRSDRPIVSSRWLYNTMHEKFTELGVQFSQDIEEIRKNAKGGYSNYLLYGIIAITVFGLGGIFYYLYENFAAIRAGLGV